MCVFLLFSGPKSGRPPPARANLLGTSATRPAVNWCDDNCNVGNQPDSAWSHWRQKSCCSTNFCPNADDNVHGTGFVLPTGHLLCPSCFTDWETEVLTQLNITASQPCFKDAKGTCSGCTLTTAPSRTRLRHLFFFLERIFIDRSSPRDTAS